MVDLSSSFDLDISVSDIYDEMSETDCQEMCNLLYENDFTPKNVESTDFRTPKTHYETEIIKLLDDIWYNRSNLISSDLEILTVVSKKGLF
jgi:hypothetical protein